MVRPGEGTEDTRQVGTKQQIGEQNWSLVSKLATERLVTTDKEENKEETVEVIHEALIRRWQRLREWVNDDRDFRLWQNRLRPRIEKWQEDDRDEDMLLRGKELLQAEEHLESYQQQIEEVAKEFIKASIDQREVEIIIEQHRREEREKLLEKEKQQQKNIILIVSLAALLALVLASAATWFGVNAAQAKEEEEVAKKEIEIQKEAAETERDRAKKAEKEAEEAENRALEQRDSARQAQEDAETQSNRAEKAEKEAEETATLMLSRYLGAKAILAAENPNPADGFVDFAALLATQSIQIKKDSESVGGGTSHITNSPSPKCNVARA